VASFDRTVIHTGDDPWDCLRRRRLVGKACGPFPDPARPAYGMSASTFWTSASTWTGSSRSMLCPPSSNTWTGCELP
jgi:hypothetical protein